jgi:hypothetical protein
MAVIKNRDKAIYEHMLILADVTEGLSLATLAAMAAKDSGLSFRTALRCWYACKVSK